MGRVVTLGEVVADVYMDPSSTDVELPFTARPGGAPANVAVGVARLGAEAAFVGRLGDDLFGRFIRRAIDNEGADTSAVSWEQPPTRTTLAFVTISDDGDRSFTFYRSDPAADELLAPEDITPDILEGASFANFGTIPLITDPVRSATMRFAELANEHRVPVAFDVNLREDLWPGLDEFRTVIEPVLDLSQVVKLSDDELQPVLGVDDPDEACDALLDRGVALALISLGADGAIYATRDFRGRVEAVELDEVVDATGAGDAFLAATLAHLAGHEHWSTADVVRTAVHRGAAAGALACSRFGAMTALPDRKTLDAFVSEHPREQPTD